MDRFTLAVARIILMTVALAVLFVAWFVFQLMGGEQRLLAKWDVFRRGQTADQLMDLNNVVRMPVPRGFRTSAPSRGVLRGDLDKLRVAHFSAELGMYRVFRGAKWSAMLVVTISRPGETLPPPPEPRSDKVTYTATNAAGTQRVACMADPGVYDLAQCKAIAEAALAGLDPYGIEAMFEARLAQAAKHQTKREAAKQWLASLKPGPQVIIPFSEDGVAVWYKLQDLPAGTSPDAVRVARADSELVLIERGGSFARTFVPQVNMPPFSSTMSPPDAVPVPQGLSLWRRRNSDLTLDGESGLRTWFAETERLATATPPLWRIDQRP